MTNAETLSAGSSALLSSHIATNRNTLLIQEFSKRSSVIVQITDYGILQDLHLLLFRALLFPVYFTKRSSHFGTIDVEV